MTLATYITYSRVLLILPILYFINLGSFAGNLTALIIFLLASITDYLDGYVARKTNTETNLGALLDLLADKLLVCLTLIWLVKVNNSLVFTIPVIIIIFRELVISSIRQFIIESQGRNNIAVSFMGKSKTTIQLIAVSLIIISPGLGFYFYSISLSFLWLAALISLISLYTYLSKWKKLV
jgi:CDP-diacylglycerol--glycerol-3-phosphate 3-phosphatidyltransferase